MVALATIVAVPVGTLAAVYVNEFARTSTSRAIRFAADVLVGVPSILIGIFVFTFLVLPFKQFNAFAGGIALAVIMIPVIMRTTEEILKLVPGSLREASLALGIPMWRTVLSIVMRTGLTGILTGVMLAVARAFGETAPLLFTALGSRLVNVGDFKKPMDALPLFIYNNARQPFPALNQQAWASALLLLIVVLAINVLVRARTWGSRAA
jgi:phosphate transport system permease protein